MSTSDPLLAWFAAQGWQPLAHQFEVYAAQDAGLSGLLIAPTGSGKTLALAGAWVRRHAGRASRSSCAAEIPCPGRVGARVAVPATGWSPRPRACPCC